jgi:hypothetical protein
MAITLDGTNGITTPDVDSTTSVTTPLVTNAGTLALSATGSNIVTVSTNGSERAQFDASGNLLVGTTTDLIGNINGYVFNAGAALNIYRTSGASQAMIGFGNGGNFVGDIRTSTTNTAYNTSSDYRLKEDVQPMVGSVDRLMALKPVNFAWKVDGSRVDGFLAHEAQEVVPEAVTGSKDAVDDEGNPQYQGIDQSKIVPLLVAALQEAITKIEALEARVAALEANA